MCKRHMIPRLSIAAHINIGSKDGVKIEKRPIISMARALAYLENPFIHVP